MHAGTSISGGRVVTLEQFIIDTFTRIGDDGVERPVDQPDQIGGGGTYAIIGARMFLSPCDLGLIIDFTPDTLPKEMKEGLCRYGEEMWYFRWRSDGHPTARAVNRYHGQKRVFEYLTDKLLLTPKSLIGTPFEHPLPSVIHFISFPAPRAEVILGEIQALRETRGWDPEIVWEPEDESLEVIGRVAGQVDIIGPNHHEIMRLFSLAVPSNHTEEQLQSIYSDACRRLAMLGPRRAAVVRCGHLGSCYALPSASGGSPEVLWVAAYWSPARSWWTEGKVVDPTGAGNAFMGGMAAALHRDKSIHEAVIWGSVAASFVIEEDGLPSIAEKGGFELWNGHEVMSRVQRMLG